ncbi:MAG TPA: glycosyltransferase family 4 protein [Candidatus Binataceae bacterium]|nr:glycosyltransferase family 4 protein [Candidatus Binataceae bacterium]
MNTYLPYGYHYAQGDGWSIVCSQDRQENIAVELIRRALGFILGFDLVHAWRNRDALRSADVVWTHTEREHLAAALLLSLSRHRPPKLLAQCIWLFDNWGGLSTPKRALYRYLLSYADIITTQSPEDLNLARTLFPAQPAACILSGGAVKWMRPPRKAPVHRPVRLAALGNDMHRDWHTLLRAFGGRSEYELVIASRKLARRHLRNAPNVRLASAETEADVHQLYQWADIVVVPLKHNRHVSGITVIFEGIISGLPVVSTDTGGLRAYFSDDEIAYVPLNAPEAMRGMVDLLCADHARRLMMTANAQRRMLTGELTKQGYAKRHRNLTEDLLRTSNSSLPATNNGEFPAALEAPREVNVFVLLGHGFGADRWRERYECGLIPGLN